MADQGFIYPFTAGEDIAAYRIVSMANGVDGIVGAGHSAVDTVTLLCGVTGDVAVASGEVADITIGGVGEVMLGGTVKQFDVLTTDSNDKAVKATANTTALVQTVGMALMGGVSGDVIKINVNPGRLEKI